MGRILTLIGLLVGLSCASAQTLTPTPTMTVSPSLTTSVVPSVSPSPEMPVIPESDYNVTNNGTICIRMVGKISVLVRYPVVNGTGDNDTLVLDVSGKAAVNRTNSHCTNKTEIVANAQMNLYWKNSDNTTEYNLLFLFKEDKDNWELNEVQFLFSVHDNRDFNNYTLQNNFNETLKATDNTTVFTNEFERSYRCDSPQNTSLAIKNSTKMMVTLSTTDWQVQAFAFPKGGNFTNDRRCTADISSSKIVPIAVGAALAGLVVVVLVAYLIGRFKNRKQNSYEALS